MSLLRLLNPQGIAGLAASVCLALLLIIEKGETRHWRKQSGQFEQLYTGEQAAFARTVADYRSAAEQARRDDAANAERVRGEQAKINEETGMTLKYALPLLALALASCATAPRPAPIPALAEQRQCPLYPLPPETLLKPPAKTDFLPH